MFPIYFFRVPKVKTKLVYLVALAVIFWCPISNATIQCPEPPQQISKDTRAAVVLEVGKLARVTGGKLSVDVNRATQDLLAKIPQSDRVYLEQMMFSAFCSSIRDDVKRDDRSKSIEIRKYAQEVRQAFDNSHPARNKLHKPFSQPIIPPSPVSGSPDLKKNKGVIFSTPPDFSGWGTSYINGEWNTGTTSGSTFTPGQTSAPLYTLYESPIIIVDSNKKVVKPIPNPISGECEIPSNFAKLPVTVAIVSVATASDKNIEESRKVTVSFDYIIVPGYAMRFWVYPKFKDAQDYVYEPSNLVTGSGRLTRFFTLSKPGQITGIELHGSLGECDSLVLKSIETLIEIK